MALSFVRGNVHGNVHGNVCEKSASRTGGKTNVSFPSTLQLFPV